MPFRLFAVAVLALLIAASPAAAATKTETASSGQTTATFTYDYKKTRYGIYDFANLHITIDRAGVRLVDEPLEDQECNGCSAWPADQASKGATSVTVRDLDADKEPEVLVDLYSGG